MDKGFLASCLANGMSLESIGNTVGKHPSTVSYWLRKHGLTAVGHDKHSPNQKVEPEKLKELVESGESIREICEELRVGYSTVRHWIKRLGLSTERMTRAREFEEARKNGIRRVYARCPKHGHTAFFDRPDGAFRCARCNSAAVARRRKRVKQILVEEAGGACVICGFDAYQGALAFHHVDPSTKAFGISRHGATRSLGRARAEAKKCVLLCANCHAQVEAGHLEVPTADDRYSSPEMLDGDSSSEVAQ